MTVRPQRCSHRWCEENRVSALTTPTYDRDVTRVRRLNSLGESRCAGSALSDNTDFVYINLETL